MLMDALVLYGTGLKKLSSHREAAVAVAYGWSDHLPWMSDGASLARLLALNLARLGAEKA